MDRFIRQWSLSDIEAFITMHPVKVPVTEFLFDNNYTSLKSNKQRVSYIMDVWKEKNFRSYSAGEFGKSLTKSVDLRFKGNNAFKKRDYMSAIALYTRSVSYAPHPYTPFINNEQSADNAGSEDYYTALALSVANRSATLFEMKKYEACLKDIAYAFSMNYPADLSHKLHLRRAKCLNALGKKHNIDILQVEFENLSLSGECTEDKKLSLKTKLENLATDSFEFLKNAAKERDESYPDVKISYSENSTLPHYSSCVELRNTEDMGRGIFATRNIEIGDVIIVEKPFTWTLIKDCLYKRCHYCCTPCDSLIPCWHCSLTMFCSEECLKKCWDKFHDLECSVLPVLLQMNFLEAGINALRTVIIASRMFKSVSDFCKTVKSFNDKNGSFPYPNIENYLEYLYVYNLVTHTELKENHIILFHFLHAVIITKLLDERTNFFSRNSEGGEEKSMLMDDLRCFIGYLLTRHLQNQFHELFSYKLDIKSGKVSTLEMPAIGQSLYPQTSLLNHSCDPNVFYYMYRENQIVIRAWRNINRGEQLFDSYGTSYTYESREERQSLLYKHYHFKCCCIACMEDWQTFNELARCRDRIKCQSCGDVLPDVKQPTIICSKCHMENNYLKICREMSVAENIVHTFNGEDGFSTVKMLLKNLNSYIRRPSSTLLTIEEYFRIYFIKAVNRRIDD